MFRPTEVLSVNMITANFMNHIHECFTVAFVFEMIPSTTYLIQLLFLVNSFRQQIIHA